MTGAIPRDTIVDTLASRLSDDILSGRYPPGAYLPPERDLANVYAVTRTSLKHAIVRLVQAGLLETRHGVGTKVRDYERLGGPELLPMLVNSAGPEWMHEIFEARREVGALLAARAADKAEPGHVHELRRLHEQLRTSADAPSAQLVECEIHRVITAAADNRVYRFMVNALLNAYMEVGELFQHAFANPAEAADRIEPVLREIYAGDPGGARAAADEYLVQTQALMLSSFPAGASGKEST